MTVNAGGIAVSLEAAGAADFVRALNAAATAAGRAGGAAAGMQQNIFVMNSAAQKAAGGVGDLGGKILGFAGALASAATVMKALDFLSVASAVNETTNILQVGFGKSAGAVDAWAASTADAMGRSHQQIRNATGSLQAMLAPMIGSKEQAGEMSKGFAKLAVDLGSFFNVADDDALLALRSGLAGESEPMRKFGVTMTEAALNAFALEKGLGRTTKEMSEGEKVALRYEFIMAKTTLAQGDAVRTADSFENSLKGLRGEMDNLQASLGAKGLSPMAGAFNDLKVTLKELEKIDMQSTWESFAAVLKVVAGWGLNVAEAFIFVKGTLGILFEELLLVKNFLTTGEWKLSGLEDSVNSMEEGLRRIADAKAALERGASPDLPGATVKGEAVEFSMEESTLAFGKSTKADKKKKHVEGIGSTLRKMMGDAELAIMEGDKNLASSLAGMYDDLVKIKDEEVDAARKREDAWNAAERINVKAAQAAWDAERKHFDTLSVGWLTEAGATEKTARQSFMDSVASLDFKGALGSGLKAFGPALSDAFFGVFSDVMPKAFNKLSGIFEKVGGPQVLAMFGGLENILGNVVPMLGSVLSAIGSAASSLVNTAVSMLQEAGNQMKVLADQTVGRVFNTAFGGTTAGGAGSEALSAATSGGAAFATVGMATPVTAVLGVALAPLAGAMIGLGAGFLELSKKTESFKRFQAAIEESTQRLVTALEPFWDSLIPLVGLFDGLVSVALPLVNAFANNEDAARLLFASLKNLAVLTANVMITFAMFHNAMALAGIVVASFAIHTLQSSDELSAGMLNLAHTFGDVGIMLLDVMRKLPGASQKAIDDLVQGIKDWQNTLPAAERSVVDGLDETIRAFSASMVDTDAMIAARNSLINLSYDEAAARRAAIAAERDVAESLQNVPSGYKIALARFNATDAAGGTMPDQPGEDSMAAAPLSLTVETMIVQTDNPEEMGQMLKERAERERFVQTGSTSGSRDRSWQRG